jgi:hypothetical protein
VSRAAGVGFPNGPVSNDAVFALPSPDLLMLSTEGRWHHDAAIRAGKRVLWRAIPRIGKRPAELGWSPAKFVAETINLTDAPSLPITDFIPWNELDLQDERGDLEDDWSNLERRYALIGGWALSVVQSLKQWSPGTRIHFGAWTPDHHALDHVTRWLEAARNCDVIDCLVPDQRVTARGVTHATMRRYEGDVITIETASGDQVTATPNHPILTRHGWVPARLIHEGSEVIQHARGDTPLGRPNDIDVPTPISEVFRALNLVGLPTATAGRVQDFHGDGAYSDVNVVRTDRPLRRAVHERAQDIVFPSALMRHALLTSQSHLGPLLDGSRPSTRSRAVIGGDGSAHRGRDPLGVIRSVLGPRALGLVDRPHRPTAAPEQRLNARRVPSESFGDVVGRLTGQVTTVRVVNVNRRRYSGHVYNLSTENGLIVADGIVTHNCHAYGSLDEIQRIYHAYRNEFSDKPLALTEWHCKGDLLEERRVLAWLAETMAADPLFEAAHFFIWRWHNAPGWWDDRWDIEHSPERLELFMNPPIGSVSPPSDEEPEPEPPQEPVMPTREDVIASSNAAADSAGIPRLLMLAAAIAESNLRADARRPADPSQDAAYWTDVSYGPWQQTVRWSQEYRDWYTNDAPGHPPATFPGSDVIEAVFDHYRDLAHAARVAARQLKAHYRPTESDAIWRALNRYNFPAGDGEPKSPANGQNYRRGIREAEAILGTSEPSPDPLPPLSATEYFEYPDPAVAGTLARCDGVIFHGSRSGRAGNPLDAEWQGTARYEQNNPLGLGWHATVGPGKVAIHLPVTVWGHNARAASSRYVGVEIAQPTVNDPLPDSVPVALADYIFDHVWPVWGEVWHFPSHAELELWGETGQKDGKSDLYPAGDERMNVFREKVYAQLRRRQEAVPPAPPEPEPVPDPSPPADTRLIRALEKAREVVKILEEAIP